MKKPIQIFFITLLLSGYLCQTTRFITAFREFSTTHSANNSLSKKINACLSLRFADDKKQVHSKKKSTESGGEFSLDLLYSSCIKISPVAKTAADPFSGIPAVSVHSAGKRGPPSFC